jgi:F-type H+-transporting ATPase subunit gamma
MPIGRKAFDNFKRTKYHFVDSHPLLQNTLNFEAAAQIVDGFIADFTEGTYDRIEIVFSEFRNAVVQIFRSEQLLPLVSQSQADTIAAKGQAKSGFRDVFIYEPTEEEIIRTLVPSYLKIQFFRFLLDTSASEHGARMTSMDKATDNAGELIKALKLDYNRARQAAITKEISEIVGGAAALEG